MIKTMTKTSLIFASLAFASAAFAAETLRLGAMPVGSGWYVGAAAIQKMVAKQQPNLAIEIMARGGGVANPMVVQNGKAQLAISNVATSSWAMGGQLLYKGNPATDIRSLVGGLNPVYVGAIARTGFLKEHNFSSLQDILESGKAVNIMMKPAGSNIPPVVDAILAAHGTSQKRIREQGGRIIQVNSAQMSGLMRDGRVDLYFDTILKGHPTITEISLTGDVTFLDISDKALAKLSPLGLQKGAYPKWFDAQTGENIGGDFGTHLIAHKSLSDETAYQITKLVVENMPALAEEFKAWKAFKPENATAPQKNGIPLHPGAIKYYKEAGLL